jgi:hypothetical protein
MGSFLDELHRALLEVDVPNTQAVGTVTDDGGTLSVGTDRGKFVEKEAAEQFGEEVFHRLVAFRSSGFS